MRQLHVANSSAALLLYELHDHLDVSRDTFKQQSSLHIQPTSNFISPAPYTGYVLASY